MPSVTIRRLSLSTKTFRLVAPNHPNASTGHTPSSPSRGTRGLKTIFGDYSQNPDAVSLYDQINDDGGGGRLWSPLRNASVTAEEYASMPIMIYLPGFDGTGLAASRQFKILMTGFEFSAFTIPVNDSTPFRQLVDDFIDMLMEYIETCGRGRPVYLLGESFGALLALDVAYRCPNLVDRLVLVNPATSFERSLWPILGPFLAGLPPQTYSALAFALAPLLGNPLSLLAYNVDPSEPIPGQLEHLVEGILELLGTLEFVADIFNPENVSQKLRLVQDGFKEVNPLLPKIKQRTLVLASGGDWMLPSANETRLERIMPRCSVRLMGLRSHALLQEGGIDLVRILKQEGFYVRQRNFSSKPKDRPKLNAFGTAMPIELPTDIERQQASSRQFNFNNIVSPVFYSTTSDNRVVSGLEGIPDERPLLFVGNHQLLGVDMISLVDHLLKERSILLRGLAHPMVMQTNEESGRASPSSFLSTFGAVRVSPKNLYKLLEQGECPLLYPGGTKESFRRKTDARYQLFWPEDQEFVRMAARFETTIITVAAVGVEESAEIVMDSEDILSTPILGDLVKRQMEEFRSRGLLMEENFILPLVIPKLPSRYYYLMGLPIKTSIEDYRDKNRSQILYNKVTSVVSKSNNYFRKQIKRQLEEDILYLQSKSRQDPYRDPIKRIIFESTNGKKQAPSFDP